MAGMNYTDYQNWFSKTREEELKKKYAYLNQAMKDPTSSSFRYTWTTATGNNFDGDHSERQGRATVRVDGGFPLQIKIHGVKDYQNQS